MTHNVSNSVPRSNKYNRAGNGNIRPEQNGSSRADGTDRLGQTRMYSAGRSSSYYDFSKARRKRDGDNNNRAETPKMSSRGKAKFGEARKEAGERRRFVERRRGAILSLAIIAMSLLILLLIYKLVFVVKNITFVGEVVYTSDELLDSSGISEGINLYSFRASTVEKQITLRCPYISEVEVNREMPNNVTITVTEDTPAYYAVIFGEYKILSSGLRVLETAESEEALPEGLIKLKLPSVSYSVAGRVIGFANEKLDRGIREVLTAASESPVSDRLTLIDLRDQFDIVMVCDGQFKLVIGDDEKLSYKLKTAAKVLEDDMFSTDNKIRIDLTTEGKTGVIIDNLMELE